MPTATQLQFILCAHLHAVLPVSISRLFTAMIHWADDVCLHACGATAGCCRDRTCEGQQPHLMVPFGLRHIFFKPNSLTLPSSGVIVAHLMPTLYFCRGSGGSRHVSRRTWHPVQHAG